jgi:hypothetical protein
MRLRRHQKQEIRRPRPTVRNCSFFAVGGERHWFHLYHRTRTLPLPVGDQKRFLFFRNTTFFRGKRRSSGPGFRRNTTWRHEKCDWLAMVLKSLCRTTRHGRDPQTWDRLRPNQISTEGDPADRAAAAKVRCGSRFAVGMLIAEHPPPRSGRARFEHPAPTLGE